MRATATRTTDAVNAIAFVRSLRTMATPPYQADRDGRGNPSRRQNQHHDQNRGFGGEGIADRVDVAIVARGVHRTIRDHGGAEDIIRRARLERPYGFAGTGP